MKKIAIAVTVLFSVSVFASPAMAWSTGDRIYVVFGSGSSARVEAGYVIVPGSSNSRIEWDSCSYCEQWASNSALYYDRAAAQRRVDQMDSDHTSVGEIAGAAAVVGGLFLLIQAFSEN